MNWFKNNLANFFTLANLACGFLGIAMVFESRNPEYAFWFMILGAIFDFFDGFIARATQTTSKIGADLDSLADMVTFGILPGFMIYDILPKEYSWVALSIPLLSAWRLAKFNNDERPNDFFYGLPSPANALYIAGFYAGLATIVEDLHPLKSDQVEILGMVLVAFSLLFSFFMISDMQLLSNKISNFTASKYKWHLAVIILAIALISFFGYLGVSFAIISYVLISIIATFASPKKAE